MLFCHKNQPSAMHPMCPIYIARKGFEGAVVTWLNVTFFRLLGVSFHPKKVLRNLKIPKFAEI